VRLGINGWRIEGRTGVPRYLSSLVQHFTAGLTESRFEEINLYTPRPLDPARTSLPEPVKTRVLRPDARMLIWENLRLGPFVGDDVLFCPSFSRPLLARSRTVVTLHDAIPHLFPEWFSWTTRVFYDRLYRWSARHADLVITISEAARRDIVRCWDVAPDRIRVIYAAAAEHFRPLARPDEVAETQRRYLGALDPFFLFVGKLSGRRSLPLLFEAFSEFMRRTPCPHKLVMVGLNIHDLDVPGMIRRLGIGARVVYPGYVPDADLNALYNAADALISPSLYETMSLPVMEAQAAGTAVICMDFPALREITGGHAVLVARPESASLFQAMALVAGEPELRRELSARGREHARRFSWRRAAEETLDALAEVSRRGIGRQSAASSATRARTGGRGTPAASPEKGVRP
jgi:glycosyltransferase involved in cell wall biosynthesis